MGTNYYLYKNTCECCGRGDEERHIGKSSGGWCFALHVYPREEINNLDDWRELFATRGVSIKDEYGDTISSLAMLDIITNRSWKGDKEKTPYGYVSWEQFHRDNHSLFGPNNLLRSKIDGVHCVGHGEGTWDLIIGDFS